MLRKTKIIMVVLTVLIVVTGCSSGDRVTKEMYDEIKDKITLDLGVTVVDLEYTMMRFIYNVYNPQSEKDIESGIELLKDITTESEYNRLIEIAGEYNEDAETSISDIEVTYNLKEHNSDKMDRVLVEFKIKVYELRQDYAIEFVFNPEGKIFKHYIWRSGVY